jgi:hypothetical protein
MCRHCIYFDGLEECHRHAPVVVQQAGRVLTLWPTVRPESGCGDFEQVPEVADAPAS